MFTNNTSTDSQTALNHCSILSAVPRGKCLGLSPVKERQVQCGSSSLVPPLSRIAPGTGASNVAQALSHDCQYLGTAEHLVPDCHSLSKCLHNQPTDSTCSFTLLPNISPISASERMKRAALIQDRINTTWELCWLRAHVAPPLALDSLFEAEEPVAASSWMTTTTT